MGEPAKPRVAGTICPACGSYGAILKSDDQPIFTSVAAVVHMYRFDERLLVRNLEALKEDHVIAFAAAAATRQLANYERYAERVSVDGGARPRSTLSQLWLDLCAYGDIDRVRWKSNVVDIIELMPDESGTPGMTSKLAEDALASLVYTIRCLLCTEVREAAWAARRAYEAADQASIRLLGIQPGPSVPELQILSHDVVQRELRRQRTDIGLLTSNRIEEVRQNAFSDNLLTESEAAFLL